MNGEIRIGGVRVATVTGAVMRSHETDEVFVFGDVAEEEVGRVVCAGRPARETSCSDWFAAEERATR